MSQLFILYESASGYCLFEKEEFDEAGGQLGKIQKSILDLDRFSKMVKLSAYQPFKTAEEALENIMTIKDNKVTETLKNFLASKLPATKSSKKQKFLLGHDMEISTVAVARNGLLVASGQIGTVFQKEADAPVILWNIQTATPLAVLKGIRGAVDKLAFSPDDRYLAAFGANHVLMIWDTANG